SVLSLMFPSLYSGNTKWSYILKNLLIYSGLKALVKRYLKKFKDYFMMLTKINIGVHNWSE
ncbi:hypothetical protein, partial [uncultured Clostridium sp.]|uniref:hypothetical protein n=1 Tax=uncultured Clostridium sp. TaxID=59620 RepID=UPI002583829D